MTPGRKQNGQFDKGVSGNPNGRPKKAREERFLEITLSAVTFKDWREIIKKAKDQAKKGNPQARKFLADYLIGPPVQRTESKTELSGEITTSVDSSQYDKALSLLAETLGGSLYKEGGEQDGEMGAGE